MVKYPLVFCDFDGTLAPEGGSVSERTKRAVADYTAAGGTFVICTGRSRVSLEKRLASVYGGARVPFICFQGGLICDKRGNILRRLTTPKEDVLRVTEAAVNAGYSPALHAGGGLFTDRRTPVTEYYERLTGCSFACVPDISAFVRDYGGEFDKMLVLSENGAESGLSDVAGTYCRGSRFVKSSPTFLELIPSQSGKGGAVRFMAERLGVPTERAAAFGDADNDVDMLEAVGLPVAMGGGMEKCIAAAELVAPPAAEDGVARVLETFIGV